MSGYSFEDGSCAVCKSPGLNNLEYQYLFVADLQDEKDTKETRCDRLPVIVSSRFLASLMITDAPAVLMSIAVQWIVECAACFATSVSEKQGRGPSCHSSLSSGRKPSSRRDLGWQETVHADRLVDGTMEYRTWYARYRRTLRFRDGRLCAVIWRETADMLDMHGIA